MTGPQSVAPPSSAPAAGDGVVLDVGPGVGALVVYAPEALGGAEVEISPENSDARSHNVVRPRRLPGPGSDRVVHAAVFPALAPGGYTLHRSGSRPSLPVVIAEACVTEVTW